MTGKVVFSLLKYIQSHLKSEVCYVASLQDCLLTFVIYSTELDGQVQHTVTLKTLGYFQYCITPKHIISYYF